MALISCIDCGAKISDAAPACIHCGRPNAPIPVAGSSSGPAPNGTTSTISAASDNPLTILGMVILTIGVVVFFFALTMDTSVPVETFGLGDSPIERVHNVGLLNTKQNYIIGAGFVAIIGLGLLIASGGLAQLGKGSGPPGSQSSDDDRICRNCGLKNSATDASCALCNASLASPREGDTKD